MRVLSIALVAGLALGCVKTSTNPVTGEVDMDVESPTKQGEDWSANLTGRGNGAGMTGTVRVAVLSGRSTATIQLTNAPPGALLPWHIHTGTCETGGPILGEASAYPPLNVGSDGRAQGTANVGARLNEANQYHVNVHASPTEMGTIVACGDLDD
jgi:hypothetical protein